MEKTFEELTATEKSSFESNLIADPSSGAETDGDWGVAYGGGTVSYSTDEAKSGSKSIKMVYSGSTGYIWLNEGVDDFTAPTDGSIYKFSCWYKVSAITGSVSHIGTGRSGANAVTNALDSTLTSTTDWVYIKKYIKWASGHADESAIFVTGINATIYFDDVKLELVNGNPGLMTNMASDDIVKDTP